MEYDHLAARMREKPSFAVAEDAIKKDYLLKLPSRRFIHLWNTPEINQFRGYQEQLEASEEKPRATRAGASRDSPGSPRERRLRAGDGHGP